MAELLELKTNCPEIIAHAYSEGREYPSNIPGAPPQIMFSLVDGRRVFWPAPFAQSLKAAGIVAKVPFEVCKAEIAKGRTQLQFKALRASGGTSERAAPASVNASAGRATQGESRIQHPHAAASLPAAPDLSAWSANDYEDAPATRLYTAPEVRNEAPALVTPIGAKLLSAYMVAVDTLIEMRVYAQRKGLEVAISCEDIRCLAATIVIDAKQGGGR
jgi:hypothetical protein